MQNLADSMTRVNWMGKLNTSSVCQDDHLSRLRELHNLGHFGVERSYGLAGKVDSNVNRKDVEYIVRYCNQCNTIDPHPIRYEHGTSYCDRNRKHHRPKERSVIPGDISIVDDAHLKIGVKSVYDVEDYVYVKPSNAKCTTRWNKGVITALISKQTAEVNGIPRHVTDIRPCNQVNKNEEQK
ncbi:hypothetical protein GJ496_005561 [Pomphorhynchus laevis]|nr:hypothetical protein GJ496_005561 [Pomphorhynchus laevis]